MPKAGTLLNSYTWVLCSRLHSWCGRVVLRHPSHHSCSRSGLFTSFLELAWGSEPHEHFILWWVLYVPKPYRISTIWSFPAIRICHRHYLTHVLKTGTFGNGYTWYLRLWLRIYWVGIERLFCLLLGHPLRRSNWLLIYHPLASWS